jgi:predicted DNA-binding protein
MKANTGEKVQTGVRIDRELYRRLKIVSAKTDRPMTELVEAALEHYLAKLED